VPASSIAAVERVSYTQELLKPPVRDPYLYPELERTPAVRSQ
jgi:hypothetical protein